MWMGKTQSEDLVRTTQLKQWRSKTADLPKGGFNKISIQTYKFQMTSGQGSHWLIESLCIARLYQISVHFILKHIHTEIVCAIHLSSALNVTPKSFSCVVLPSTASVHVSMSYVYAFTHPKIE